jgi:hypothetical protein
MGQMGTGDDMEANASTFFKEMREVAFILDAVAPVAGSPTAAQGTSAGGVHEPSGEDAAGGAGDSEGSPEGAEVPPPRVLVLLDELGRG